MTKKPINITLDATTPVAKVFMASVMKKEDFRKFIEIVSSARQSNEAKPNKPVPFNRLVGTPLISSSV